MIPSIGFRGHFEGYVATLDSAFCTEMCQKSKSPTCLLFVIHVFHKTTDTISSLHLIVLKALMEIEKVELHQKKWQLLAELIERQLAEQFGQISRL